MLHLTVTNRIFLKLDCFFHMNLDNWSARLALSEVANKLSSGDAANILMMIEVASCESRLVEVASRDRRVIYDLEGHVKSPDIRYVSTLSEWVNFPDLIIFKINQIEVSIQARILYYWPPRLRGEYFHAMFWKSLMYLKILVLRMTRLFCWEKEIRYFIYLLPDT